MVGVVGIEPTHGGVKVPCLTTWLHPRKWAPLLYKTRKKVKIFLMFFCFFVSYAPKYILIIYNIMMKLVGLLMKRPSDTQVRYGKMIVGIILIVTSILAFWVQNLAIENFIFGFALNADQKLIFSYAIIALWAFPLLLWGLDINLLSRGYTRILQIIFGIFLMFLSGIFIETATLSVNIIYFLIGLFVFFVGVTGKAITKKGLKHGQKITKIRV